MGGFSLTSCNIAVLIMLDDRFSHLSAAMPYHSRFACSPLWIHHLANKYYPDSPVDLSGHRIHHWVSPVTTTQPVMSPQHGSISLTPFICTPHPRSLFYVIHPGPLSLTTIYSLSLCSPIHITVHFDPFAGPIHAACLGPPLPLVLVHINAHFGPLPPWFTQACYGPPLPLASVHIIIPIITRLILLSSTRSAQLIYSLSPVPTLVFNLKLFHTY